MFGLSPRAFHLTNLALHCLVVVLLYDTAVTRLVLSPTASLLAAAMFAVHPVHSEAVSCLLFYLFKFSHFQISLMKLSSKQGNISFSKPELSCVLQEK